MSKITGIVFSFLLLFSGLVLHAQRWQPEKEKTTLAFHSLANQFAEINNASGFNPAPKIHCSLDQTICLLNAASYTHSGNTWDATGSSDTTCKILGSPTFSYTAVGPIDPASGSTLYGATFGPGVTTITWTIADPCGNTASCSFTIRVYPSLNPGSHNTDTIHACVGYDPSTLTVIGTSGGSGVGTYSYQWLLNGSAISGETSASYDPPLLSTAGIYNYNCIVSDACGNTSYTVVKTIIISNDPVVNVSGGGTICQNSSIILKANVSGGAGAINYQWQSATSATGPWTNIPGATNTSYSPSTSAAGIFY